MSEDRKEIIELMKALIDSTRSYVSVRIQNKDNKLAYLQAIDRCFTLCEVARDKAALELGILALMYYAPQRSGWFNRTNEYYKLGIDHSLDVVQSISKRFGPTL